MRKKGQWFGPFYFLEALRLVRVKAVIEPYYSTGYAIFDTLSHGERIMAICNIIYRHCF